MVLKNNSKNSKKILVEYASNVQYEQILIKKINLPKMYIGP